MSKKPDLSHLRIWGCQCFPAIPPELRTKAGPRHFEAIFIGYEEARVGWVVRDLKGGVHFSRDVIFNEDLSGRLGVPRSLPSQPISPVSPPLPDRPVRDRMLTVAGRDYQDLLHLKELRRLDRSKKLFSRAEQEVQTGGDGAILDKNVVVDAANGGVSANMVNCAVNGGDIGDILPTGVNDLTPSDDVLLDFLSFLAPSTFPNQVDTDSLVHHEFHILLNHSLSLFSGSQNSPLSPVTTSVLKPPLSYAEAVARPDAPVWFAAMDREKASLLDMGAFMEEDLPKGAKTIGLKWVYAYKTDANGDIIKGKEKARVVAQGFSQRPGKYDETYAPVAKLSSVQILLAWATSKDLDIYQFDCKTAFLHAKVHHPIYARPFPGYKLSEPNKVLRVLVALYGLRQSAYEFYMLFSSLLLALGMVRCEVDHGVFFGEWTSPPDSSIPMPLNGTPLVLYVPLHVDDGLGITNSLSLYKWFILTLAKRLLIVDLGECSKFLSIVIICDRPSHRMWLSSHLYVSELLDEWNLTSCKPVPTPFPCKMTELPLAPSNSLPRVSDAELTPKYQRIVGCLLYLAVTTRPDLAYCAMWLGQHNATPTHAHFLAAKHILRYLAGTASLALRFGSPLPILPATLSGFMQNVGCSDVDWASDALDRKSISGYSFYFEGSLISWSATKQKSIALSSTEAKYYAMSHAFKEALWLCVFLGLLHSPVPRPFPILSDNQAACSLSNSPAISARSKHIDIRHHFIRAHVQDGSFSTIWIPTDQMPANIFTKPLPFSVFARHRDVLGLSVPII